MKKILLNESEKKAIILEKEKAIIESFAKTFNKIKRIDENKLIKENQDGLLEFDIPEWALSALINGDYSGLEGDDEAKINQFVSSISKEYGNANFMLNDIEGEDNLGFKHTNDIDNLGSNVYRLYLRPSETSEPMRESNIMGGLEYKILEGYLTAALWTEQDELGGATINDLTEEAKQQANQDVLSFMQQAGNLLDGIDPEQVGHDLWLTRNGHGAGFWDRGLGEKGDALTRLAKAMGGKDLYKGDDEQLHFS